MKPFDRLSGYLGVLERRMRWLALTRGAAAIAAAALALTVLAVLVANQFAFSHGSVLGARVFLFLGLGFAIAAALVVPLIRLNRRRAARAAETTHPEFEERLLTFTERSESHPGDPFLHLLAADALRVADHAQPKSVVKATHLFGFSSAAIAAIAVLLWIATFQGFLGYGTGLLWGSVPKGMTKAFYTINVAPGNKTVRKRSDQVITAQLVGFTSPKVQFFAKYASATAFEGADMGVQDSGSAYQFLIAGVPESLEYYIEAGGVRSTTYKLNVVDLPAVKKVAVTFHYPAYLGLKDTTEDPGGDLRAVQGTVGEVFVTFDKPLASGEIVLDDGTKIALAKGATDALTAKVPIEKDGMYHIAALENGDDVRLSEDYFIEAMKDEAPEVSITKPGRDFRASPIEEVTVAVSAKDDFGLKDVALHYSVNGAPEKTIPLLQAKGAKESNGSTVLSFEDFKAVPGDVVSIYATANDARNTSKTDIFFIQAEPFERNYTQSQDGGGGGGGGGGGDANEQNQISQRQKEIITATWNQEKGTGARGTDAENAAFLSSVQSKLRDQASSLAQRMKSRELDEAGDSFKSFVSDMEQAVAAMGPAADKLKSAKWQDALAPEQKALQYLLRAEATFRDIQVAMRQGGGGGGGGGGMSGATRDLEGLFDLELDTQKNQYESQSSSSGQAQNQQQQQIDDALQKLAELAKRQQELADQQKKNPEALSQQRYEQEMLRREAEQLRQQLDQLNRQQQQNQLSRNGQQSQSGQSGQPGQAGQSGQSGQQQGQMSQQGGQSGDQQMQQLSQMAQRGQQQNQQNQQQQQQMGQDQRLNGASAQQLKKALDSLEQAEQDMRNAQQQGSMQSDAEAKRAAERLNDATQTLQGLRQAQSSNQIEQLSQQADQAARAQQQFEGDLRHAVMQGDGMTRDQAGQLADRHQAQVNDVKKLEEGMQNAVRDLMGTQRQASNKLRQTLGDLEQAEIPRDMQRDADWIRRGMGEYAAMSEAQITAGLNELRDRMAQLQKDMAAAGGQQQKSAEGDKALQDSLNQVQQLRQMVEQRAAQLRQQNGQGQPGQNGQQRQSNQLSRNGQQGQQNGQQGQQNGQQGQQNGQQGQQNGQQGQQGGQNGQQAGQQGQQGGQQGQQGQPGQQGGGNNAGYNNNGGYNGGNWNPQGGPNYNGYGYRGGNVRDQDIQQAYRNALQSLQQLQQQYRGDPNAIRDWNNVIRDLRQFDPYALNNDPLLSERIQAALGNIEQAEMELRRKADETGAGDGSIRSPSSEPTPQGYGSAVAEYFRKLSKTGK